LIQEKLNIDKYLDGFQNLKLVDFIFENQITILILLGYIKAKDWPYKGKKLNNDPIINIPMIWAIFYSDNGKDVSPSNLRVTGTILNRKVTLQVAR